LRLERLETFSFDAPPLFLGGEQRRVESAPRWLAG
jgi:hypothetical protein